MFVQRSLFVVLALVLFGVSCIYAQTQPLQIQLLSSDFSVNTSGDVVTLTFDNTMMANASMWFKYQGLAVEGGTGDDTIVVQADFFYGTQEVMSIMTIQSNTTIDMDWIFSPCPQIINVYNKVISTDNMLGTWTLNVTFSAKTTNAFVINGTVTIAAESTLLQQQAVVYSQTAHDLQFFTFDLPAAQPNAGYQSQVSLTIADSSGSLSWLQSISLSNNNNNCSFKGTPYYFAVNTTSASQTVTVLLPAGVWVAELVGYAPAGGTVDASWSAVVVTSDNVLTDQSVSGPAIVSKDTNWVASLNFGNTIAGAVIYVGLTAPIVEGMQENQTIGCAFILYYTPTGSTQKTAVFQGLLIYDWGTVTDAWYAIPPCATIPDPAGNDHTIKTGNKTGIWTAQVTFMDGTDGVVLNGQLTVGAQYPVLAQSNTKYSVIKHENQVYVQFTLPEPKKSGSTYDVEFYLENTSGPLTSFGSIYFTNSATCSFLNNIEMNVTTTATSTTVKPTLAPGLWTVFIQGNSQAVVVSWNIVATNEPEGSSFWTTTNIIIIASVVVGVVLVIAVAIVGFVWYKRSREYESL